MITFAPNTIIKSSDHNANFTELKAKTDLLIVPSPDSAWHEVGAASEPAFQNSWINYPDTYNTAGFRKDAFGFVHLKGLVKSGTLGTTMFTLPAGYRPVKQLLLPVSCSTATGAGRVDITIAGAINVHATMAANGYLSLDGITFKAEA